MFLFNKSNKNKDDVRFVLYVQGCISSRGNVGKPDTLYKFDVILNKEYKIKAEHTWVINSLAKNYNYEKIKKEFERRMEERKKNPSIMHIDPSSKKFIRKFNGEYFRFIITEVLEDRIKIKTNMLGSYPEDTLQETYIVLNPNEFENSIATPTLDTVYAYKFKLELIDKQ